MLTEWITLILSNFSFVMFMLAVIFIILHKLIVGRRVTNQEMIYRWIAVFALGFTGVYAFVLHAFFPQLSAATVGWAASPFQFEVAVADLALGLLGILSFRADYSFRLATVIASIVMLWGDALGHVYQQIQTGNFSTGNAGSWFLTDIFVPLLLLLCIIKLKPGKSKT